MPSPDRDIPEEIKLLAATGRGDRAAFRALYAQYGAPLFTLALRLVGDRGAAEEVLQDTFVKIWRHASTYDDRKSRPFTWSVTILRRTAIDHLRRHRHDAGAVALPADDLAPGEFATAETARRAADSNDVTARVQGVLTTIAPPQRDALELALFSTLTHAEIAIRLAQPLGSVKTWIRRGLGQLRTTLNESAP